MYEGLQYARWLSFPSVELNVDSSAVVKILLSMEDVSLTSRSLVQKIWRLLQMYWEVKVRHSYRVANSCADALANISYNMRSILKTYESCPPQIRHLFSCRSNGSFTPSCD